MEFIETRMAMYPDFAKIYEKLANLKERRLWHQLTEELLEFTGNKKYHRDLNMVELYEGFIADFEAKLNQIKFVQIMSNIAEQFCPVLPSTYASAVTSTGASASSSSSTAAGSSENLVENIGGLHQAVSFMQTVVDKKDRIGEEGYLLAQMAVAGFRIRIGTSDNLEIASSLLDEAKPLMQSLEGSGAEVAIYSRFHKVSAELFKRTGPADSYYSSCLQYLAYTPHTTLSVEDQLDLSINMSLAALVGDNMFNFGEVLAEPVIEILKTNQKYGWIYELIAALSTGDVDLGAGLLAKYEKEVSKIPSLASNLETIKQKIAILCVMRMVFERPAEERNISFDDISVATRLPYDQVEWLLMRAMAKDLIRGKMDEVEQVIRVTWLRPRVLNKVQMTQLNDKLTSWAQTVKNTLLFIEGETPELFQ